MSSNRVDAMVLGAGIVGVSVALHLQERGLKVALVDRRAPGMETSHGNAGFIEASAILPHPFPKGIGNLMRFALNRSDAVRADYSFLPQILPWLIAYKRASASRALNAIGPAFRSLIRTSLAEHRHLMEQAGAMDLLVEDGWLELCRTAAELEDADRSADPARALGIAARRLDPAALQMLEPALKQRFAGAIHWSDTARITDPGQFVRRLADLFAARQGIILQGDAMRLQQGRSGWKLALDGILLEADHTVVALGPWSSDLTRRFGYNLPLAAKRGYHRHFEHSMIQPLTRPIYVRDRQCLIVPALQGVRVMTGVELADRDARPDHRQIDRMVACAGETIDLGKPVDETPWLGARPCMPDMLPVIGAAPRHPGLWFAFGHGHYGLTQGPVTGRLIADLVTGSTPHIPVDAFAPGRFEKGASRPERMAG